jgi:hypothetical protein
VLASGGLAAWIKLLIFGGIFYHLYNQASYMVLDQGISPVTFSVGNTMKRVAVVVSSVLFFKNPVSSKSLFSIVLLLLLIVRMLLLPPPCCFSSTPCHASGCHPLLTLPLRADADAVGAAPLHRVCCFNSWLEREGPAAPVSAIC